MIKVSVWDRRLNRTREGGSIFFPLSICRTFIASKGNDFFYLAFEDFSVKWLDGRTHALESFEGESKESLSIIKSFQNKNSEMCANRF